MDGLYFNDSMEPDDEVFRLRNAIEDLAHQEGVDYIGIKFDTPEDYYALMNAMRYFVDDNIKIYTSTKDNEYSVIVNEDITL